MQHLLIVFLLLILLFGFGIAKAIWWIIAFVLLAIIGLEIFGIRVA